MSRNRTTSGKRSVGPETLDNQERGLVLETRAAGPGPAPDQSADVCTEEEPAPELLALRERVKAAKAARPNPAHPHCLDCFRRGWAAAVGEIEGGAR